MAEIGGGQSITDTLAGLDAAKAKVDDLKGGVVGLKPELLDAAAGVAKLGEAFVTGNFSGAGEAIKGVVTNLTTLGPVAGTVASAVELVAGGFVAAAREAQQFRQTVDDLRNASLNMGNGQLFNVAAVGDELKKLHGVYGVSTQDAGIFVGSMQQVADISDEARAKMTEYAATYATLGKKDPAQAADLFTQAASGNVQAILRLDKELKLLNDEQLKSVQIGDASKDSHVAQALALEVLEKRYGGFLTKIEERKKDPTAYMEGLAQEKSKGILARQDRAGSKQDVSFEPPKPMTGEAVTRATPGASLQLIREEDAKIKADTSKTNAEILAAEIELWKQKAETWHKDSTERELINRQVVALERQLKGQQATDDIRQAQATIQQMVAAKKLGGVELLKAEQAQWQALLDGDKLSGEQRKQVQSSIDLLQAQIEGTKNTERVKTTQATGDQVVQIERKTALEIAQLRNQNSQLQESLAKETAAYQKAADRILEIERKLQAQIDALRSGSGSGSGGGSGGGPKSGAAGAKPPDPKADAEKYKKVWDDAFKPIETGFDSMISHMMKGNVSLRQAASEVGKQMLQDSLKTGAQKLVQLGLDKAKELALDLTINKLKVTDSIVSKETEHAAHFALGQAEVAEMMAMEGEKTAVTATGATARTGIETTAAGTSIMLSIGTGIKDIAVKAAQGFAGAYAAIASIPWVGPVLAPAAAAAAFAGIMAIGSKIFSAEGGFDVPSGSNPMTQLHENEMVLPAHIATPLRQALAASPRLMVGLGAGGGTLAGGGGNGGITHSGNINLSITAPAQALSRMSPGEAQRWVAAQIQGGMRQAYLRMAPA